MSKTFALNRIAIMMGGRIAEELVFDQITTGAGNDIEQATDLARRMVTEWGMSEKIGPLNFKSGGQEVFLGRDFQSGADTHSEDTSRRIDEEVYRIVMEQYRRARALLEQSRDALEAVGEALLEHETLSGEDIEVLRSGGTIDRRAPKSPVASDDEDVVKTKRGLFPPIGVGKGEPEPDPA